MILVWLIAVPVIGGLVALALGDRRPRAVRWASLAFLALDLVLALTLIGQGPLAALGGAAGIGGAAGSGMTAPPAVGSWLAGVRWAWIPQFGISFHLGADGLSLLMVLLTLVLGLISVGCSWRDVTERVAFFHLNLLLILAGILGVFLALDLFLFYFFWELMLVPMYFLIGIWGHERRIYAALKFFIFTQASGLLMLAAIVGLAFAHGEASGAISFDYFALLGTPLAGTLQMWLMLGFFIAFAVKLPMVPLHTWLPDAHTEAPTAGSVILAGLLLKTGAYGLIRFAVPLFPQASVTFAPAAVWLGVAGILYGALMAFGQTDFKRLVAYTSVSHLGFVLLGIYAWNALAAQGAVVQMIAHGLSTGGLFVLVGALSERTGTRELSRFGGLWSVAPRMGGVGMVLALASLGLPGLANFVAEFLVLAGAYQTRAVATIVAGIGLVTATVYSLWIVQRVFHGRRETDRPIPDLGARELVIFGVMIAILIWLGVAPQPVIDAANSAVGTIQQAVGGGAVGAPAGTVVIAPAGAAGAAAAAVAGTAAAGGTLAGGLP